LKRVEILKKIPSWESLPRPKRRGVRALPSEALAKEGWVFSKEDKELKQRKSRGGTTCPDLSGIQI